MAMVPAFAMPGVADARKMGPSTEAGATHLLAQVTQFLLIIKTGLGQDYQMKVVLISEVGNTPGKPPKMHLQG